MAAESRAAGAHLFPAAKRVSVARLEFPANKLGLAAAFVRLCLSFLPNARISFRAQASGDAMSPDHLAGERRMTRSIF